MSTVAADYDPHSLLGEFRTDLWLPRYPPVDRGPWSVRQIMMAAARGYWGDVYRIDGTIVLTGPGIEGRAAWMSMTPSEIESQEIGLAHARGHTVVLGMGMGWLAANVALRHDVSQVTVIERDPDVISLIEAVGVFDQLPAAARAKIDIVQADALTWRPSTPVDSLQADIWERFVEPRKLSDVRTMQANIGAASIYFWGQEMEIWRHARRRADEATEPTLDWPLVRTIVSEDIALPLALPEWVDFPQKITAAAAWWTPRDDAWWRAD